MISRNISGELPTCSGEYPVGCITGPRQSGKTTPTRAVFTELPSNSFEDPLVRDDFAEDPVGFIHRPRDGAVFGEV